jgi:hypothetical protein
MSVPGHLCDIARPPMDFRFRGKSGHAMDIAPRTEFDPICDIDQFEIPQRGSRLYAIPFGSTGGLG